MPFIQSKQSVNKTSEGKLRNSNVKMSNLNINPHQNKYLSPEQYYGQNVQTYRIQQERNNLIGNNNGWIEYDKRPRMSRSMDNMVMRPISYSGYNPTNLVPVTTNRINPVQLNNHGLIPNAPYMLNNKPISPRVGSNEIVNKIGRDPIKSIGMNGGNNLRQVRKQSEIDSEYKMPKPVVYPSNMPKTLNSYQANSIVPLNAHTDG